MNGDEFVLSSAHSNIETVRKLSSCYQNDDYSQGGASSGVPRLPFAQRNSEIDLVESPSRSPMKARLGSMGGVSKRKTSSK